LDGTINSKISAKYSPVSTLNYRDNYISGEHFNCTEKSWGKKSE